MDAATLSPALSRKQTHLLSCWLGRATVDICHEMRNKEKALLLTASLTHHVRSSLLGVTLVYLAIPPVVALILYQLDQFRLHLFGVDAAPQNSS